MILLDNLTIPSSFQKLDTRVTAADQCANVRDIQRVVLNHNILVSRRIRRTVFSQMSEGGSFYVYTAGALLAKDVPPVFDSGVFLASPYAKTFRFAFYAERSIATGDDPQIGVYVWNAGELAEPSTEDQIEMVTITAAVGSPAWFTVDVAMPYGGSQEPMQLGGRVALGYRLYAVCPIRSTVFSAAAVIDAAADWIRVNTTGGGVGYNDILYVDGVDAPPVLLTDKVISFGASDQKFFPATPLTYIPIDTDTVTIKDVVGIRMHAMSIHELTVDAFDSAQGAL